MDDKDVWAVTHAHSARTSPSIEGQELSSSLAENSALPQRSPSQAFLYDDLGANWGSPAAEETIEAEGLHSLPGLDPAAVDQSNESKTEAVSPAVAPPSALAQTFSKTSPTKDHGDDKDEVEEFADFEDENHDSRTSNRSRAAAAQDQLEAKDDDFDDFGYFPDEVAEQAGNADFGDDAFGDDAFGDAAFDEGRRGTDWWDQKPPTASFAGVSTPDWQPLQIRDANGAIASVEALSQQISAILSAPLSPGGPTNPFGKAATSELTPDAVRQVEGVSQVLASESSRKLLADLSRQPQLKPVDWLRSRTRKDLYISLGVPINLDELQTAGSSSSKLPPLSLTLDFGVSREPGPTSAPALDSTGLRRAASGQFSSSASPGSIAATRSGSATGVFTLKRSDSTDAARKQRVRERRLGDLGLEPTPEVDMRRLEEVCALTEDQLSLLSLPSLRSLVGELENLAHSTSVLLTHNLTLRESLQADSEMYNGLIKDLVRGAANTLGGGRDSNRRSMATSSGAHSAGANSPTRRFTSGGGPSSSMLCRSDSPRPQSPLSRPATGSAPTAVRR